MPPIENRTALFSWDSWTGLLLWGQEELAALGPRESQTNAEYLLEEVTGRKRWELALQPHERPGTAEVERYRQLIAIRRERVPAAYVTGKAYFRNECLEVGPGCLVPRPETELLVEAVIQTLGWPADKEFSFLDLGTGSGAIAISLLRHFSRARAVMADLSPNALQLARRNAARYDLTPRIDAVQTHFFDRFQEGSGRPRWSVIVSNPPYLADKDWASVEPELLHEPRLALDGGADGLNAYRVIAAGAPDFLQEDGWLFLEIGQGQGPAVRALLEQNHFRNIAILKDYSGIDRIVTAQKGQHG